MAPQSETPRASNELELRRLASLYGIKTGDGQDKQAAHGDRALRQLLTACGVAADSESGVRSELERAETRLLEPVYVVIEGEPSEIKIRVPREMDQFRFAIAGADGKKIVNEHAIDPSRLTEYGADSSLASYVLQFGNLPIGYYDLTLTLPTNGKRPAAYQALLIVAPKRVFDPRLSEMRLWSPLVSLAGLRSDRNWGIGDFTDLYNFAADAIKNGAAGVAVSPLQELSCETVEDPQSALYSALSFIDFTYIDVEMVEDFKGNEDAQREILAPEFRERMAALRAQDAVDLAAVREVKLKALSNLYQKFRQSDLRENSQRARAFRSFVSESGFDLRQWALYHALAEHSKSHNWSEWPEQLRDSQSEALQQFLKANEERVEFYLYLQWIAQKQLGRVSELCRNAKLPLGLCLTVSVSIAPSGFETWRHRYLFAPGARAAAPTTSAQLPGTFNEAAMIPAALRDTKFGVVRDAVASHGRVADTILLPDVQAFDRKFWLVEGSEPVVASVSYPLNELMAACKVECHRQRCDLIAAGFEKLRDAYGNGRESIPERFGVVPMLPVFASSSEVFASDEASRPTPCALVPAIGERGSFVAYWLGADLQADEATTAESRALRDSLVAHRVLERVDLLRKLEEHELLPEGMAVDPASAAVISAELSTAFYSMISSETANVLFLPLDDLAGRNITDEVVTAFGANEKLTVPLAELFGTTAIKSLIKRLSQDGRSITAPVERLEQAAESVRAIVPHGTYRLQLHKDFTFKDAEALVPYLQKLGVSHLYSSPFLTARPGSMHGYDIISHKQLNPEIGSNADLDSLDKLLKSRGMGLVLDMVPNHMGIGTHNAWWMDVLENGPASQFANYFDIDWSPIKPELHGKVTIPVLGDVYGNILRSGQLKLTFYPDRGSLAVRYYEHELPLNPLTYPVVLGQRVDVLKDRLGADDMDVLEYQSIITAFSHLPGHMEYDKFNERIREKRLQMRRLADLCKRNPTIADFIEQNLEVFEVKPDDAASIQRMNALLERQAYRLVFWRVATDEINYRRFFDVNDLAAVRTEDPRVFAEMHDLIFKLIADRKIDGLRIDHPDGLYDPAAYFQNLQEKAAECLGGRFSGEIKQSTLPFYIVVEKILAPFERLEEDWAVQGTTGYDFLNELNDVFVASANEETFDRIYTQFIGSHADYEKMRLDAKRTILDTVLASELNVLAHRLSQIAESSWYFRDFTLNSLRYALRETVLHFPVYRTYVTPRKVDKSAYQYIDWAIGRAKKKTAASNSAVYDFIRDVLTLKASENPLDKESDQESEFARAVQTFAMKFQQFTGPVMAKSVEDTLFYRYTRFVCLNEVGGEPDRFGTSVSGFHQKNQQRQQRQPYTMLASSTHDTKRSEDVRARLAVLSELPKIWEKKVDYWARMNRGKKTPFDDDNAPDNNDEYFIYQSIVGACPFELSTDEQCADFRERIKAYVLKAAREAKRFTSWVNQNGEYENALTQFVERLLTPSNTNLFISDLMQFQELLVPSGLLNGLGQAVLKLTCPGIPDIYQGTELWDFSLVDPDNRRPVDYAKRKKMLDEMEQYLAPENAGRAEFTRSAFAGLRDGKLKLYLIACLMRARNADPELFTDGQYIPLEVTGPGAEHVIAFGRELNGKRIVVAVPHMLATLLKLDDTGGANPIDIFQSATASSTWTGTNIILPASCTSARARNLFTSEEVSCEGDKMSLSDLFKTLPVAVCTLE